MLCSKLFVNVNCDHKNNNDDGEDKGDEMIDILCNL